MGDDRWICHHGSPRSKGLGNQAVVATPSTAFQGPDAGSSTTLDASPRLDDEVTSMPTGGTETGPGIAGLTT
jgi:hypothetical protein